ncbi:adhesin [Streptomyces sp. NPDC057638]|uniref:adhesin n=1 Tax=Streptomyces sp. NPDC057638 TaxID=3346190 RepID=UPI003691E174
MARETLRGRFSLLSRTGKTLLACGAALTAVALAASALQLSGGSSEGGDGDAPVAAAGDSLGGLGDLEGAPERIEPSVPPPFPSPAVTTGSASAPAPATRPAPAPTAMTSHPARAYPSRTAARPVYRAWAGPGCSGGGEYRERGRYHDGEDGWYSRARGGHRGHGCDGRFTAIPMSGSPDQDSAGSATWSWRLGPGYRHCALRVVVPRGERDQDAAGAPSVYQVLDHPDADRPRRTFRLDQEALRGGTAVVRDLSVRGRWLTVRLTDRGVDWGEGREGAHHAAAQMRAECWA